MFIVRSHSRYHKLSLLVRQPARLLGEIRNEKESQDANQHGGHSFQDKDPSPITQPTDSIHLENCASKKAAKRFGHRGGTPENGEAPLRFFSLVPEAENVKAYIMPSVMLVSERLSVVLPGNTSVSAKPRKNLVARSPL